MAIGIPKGSNNAKVAAVRLEYEKKEAHILNFGNAIPRSPHVAYRFI